MRTACSTARKLSCLRLLFTSTLSVESTCQELELVMTSLLWAERVCWLGGREPQVGSALWKEQEKARKAEQQQGAMVREEKDTTVHSSMAAVRVVPDRKVETI